VGNGGVGVREKEMVIHLNIAILVNLKQAFDMRGEG